MLTQQQLTWTWRTWVIAGCVTLLTYFTWRLWGTAALESPHRAVPTLALWMLAAVGLVAGTFAMSLLRYRALWALATIFGVLAMLAGPGILGWVPVPEANLTAGGGDQIGWLGQWIPTAATYQSSFAALALGGVILCLIDPETVS